MRLDAPLGEQANGCGWDVALHGFAFIAAGDMLPLSNLLEDSTSESGYLLRSLDLSVV